TPRRSWRAHARPRLRLRPQPRASRPGRSKLDGTMARRALRERLLYFALVPAIVIAVLVLGGVALRTTLQIEKSRQQTVFDATLTLADERVDRLDKGIIAQDNVVAAHVDLDQLDSIARRWIPTAARETPTVRAILVLDMDHEEHDVLAFASRASAPGGA